MRYQFEIFFTPGNQMYLADLLSRAAKEPNREETMAGQRVETHVRTIVAADDMYKEELRRKNGKNNNYLQALEEVRGGWVEKGKSYKEYLRRLYTLRENTTVKDNILMCGKRVVIPDNMRTKLLYRMHKSHQSAGKCIEKTRESLWRPQINKDVTEWILQNCSTCIINSENKHYPLIT